MANRIALHELLKEILGSDHVYYRPPSGFRLKYPCIVYDLDRQDISHADNRPYVHKDRYSITVIDRDPDSTIPMKIAELPTVAFDRSFVLDNLNHTIYSIYY